MGISHITAKDLYRVGLAFHDLRKIVDFELPPNTELLSAFKSAIADLVNDTRDPTLATLSEHVVKRFTEPFKKPVGDGLQTLWKLISDKYGEDYAEQLLARILQKGDG